MTNVTKPKPKKPPRLYRVALISDDLRYELEKAASGTSAKGKTGGHWDWVIRDLILSDYGTRMNINDLSGDAWIDGKADPRWPELLDKIVNEPAQIEWRAEKLRIARERAANKRAERRAA